MIDIRLVKTYSNDAPLGDALFIRDTLYTRIKNLELEFEGDTFERLADFQMVLPADSWTCGLELANVAAGLILDAGKLTFRQVFAIARMLGCDAKAGDHTGEPQPELHGNKLLDQIKAFFAAEWEIVSKGEQIHFECITKI
jgi:hypothetical protein